MVQARGQDSHTQGQEVNPGQMVRDEEEVGSPLFLSQQESD